MTSLPIPSALLLAALCGSAAAQDRTELERTPIVGNRELPKVLYIVPWKKPAAAPLPLRPPGSVLDEAPAAVDREVLRRQLRQQAQLRERAAAATADPSSTPPSIPTAGARP